MIILRILDQLFANKIKGGSGQAFEELLNKYKGKVFSYCLNFTNNFYQAEDIAQEIFIRIYKNINKYDAEKASLSTWIYTITHNTCINYIRNAVSHVELDEAAVQDNRTPEEQAVLGETLSRLKKAIWALSEEDRSLVLMKDFLGLKYKEIAKISNIPEGTVKSRIYSLRQKIRAMVGDIYD